MCLCVLIDLILFRNVSLITAQAIVIYDSKVITITDILDEIEDIGFDPMLINEVFIIHDIPYISSIAIDMYYGVFYIVLKNWILFRFEKKEVIENNNELKCIVTNKYDLNKILSKSGKIPMKPWKIHFDSILERLIIVDNCHVQAVYL